MDSLKDYNFASKFTEILFKKIKEEIGKIAINNNESEKYILVENIRSLLISYNELKYDSILNAFFYKNTNLELFFNIYKELFINQEKYDIWIENDLNNFLKTKLENLDKNYHGVWSFYKILEEHISNNKNDIEYIKSLISDLLDIYFSSNKILENRKLVEKFPYKIRLSLVNDKNIETYKKEIYKIIFSKTLDYIIEDIQQHYLDDKIEFNYKIHYILNYWLIEFEDIITLSKIFFILFVPYGNNRAESIIKGKRTFGHISRIKVSVGNNIDKNYNKKYENTINKFKELLPGLINKEELEKLLKEFEEIIKENKMEEKYILIAKNYKKLIEDLLK